MGRERPNILILMTDQMAAPSLPFHGHAVVQAPHLQRLAAGGVVFESAPLPSWYHNMLSIVQAGTCQTPNRLDFDEESARVPLVVHAPARFAPHCVSIPVSLLDLLPTLVEVASGEQTPELAAPVDGHPEFEPLRRARFPTPDIPPPDFFCRTRVQGAKCGSVSALWPLASSRGDGVAWMD